MGTLVSENTFTVSDERLTNKTRRSWDVSPRKDGKILHKNKKKQKKNKTNRQPDLGLESRKAHLATCHQDAQVS